LERSGCRVTVVDDGLEGLLALQELKIDAMLVDLGLPLMSGGELTRRVRETERITGARRLPILAVSSQTSSEEIDGAFAAGVDGYVCKPYRPDDLLTALRRVLSEDSGRLTVAA
jgi:CheY-like chemotaxis protein